MELKSELNDIVSDDEIEEAEEKPAPKQPPKQTPSHPPAPQHREEKPTVPPRGSSVANELPSPVEAKPVSRGSSPPAQKKPTLSPPEHQDGPKSPAVNPNESISTKAERILTHRRDLYMRNAKAAKEAGDLESAKEYLGTLKMFQMALESIRAGETLGEEDLEQIPPSPPPYRVSPDHHTQH